MITLDVGAVVSNALNNNAGQEQVENKTMHMNIDPLFNNTSFDSADKNAFLLEKNTQLQKQVFMLPGYFSITGNATDFGGNVLPADKKIIPGVYIK